MMPRGEAANTPVVKKQRKERFHSYAKKEGEGFFSQICRDKIVLFKKGARIFVFEFSDVQITAHIAYFCKFPRTNSFFSEKKSE